MTRKKLPDALKGHQFSKGSKKSKKAGGKGGRKSSLGKKKR